MPHILTQRKSGVTVEQVEAALPPSMASGSAAGATAVQPGNAGGGAETATAGRTSTVAAPVLRDFVSVLDAPYSVNNKGEGNQTKAINEVDAAVAAAGAGVLYFPPGKYKAKENLTPSSNNTWEGAGTGTVFELEVSTATKKLEQEATCIKLTGTSTTLRSFKLVQTGVTGRTGLRGSICNESTTHATFEHLWIGEGSAVGLWSVEAAWMTVKDCFVTETKADGIMTTRGSKHCTITGNTFLKTGDDCISVGSWIKNLKEGEANYAPCEDIKISNNTGVEGKARLIGLYGGNNLKVSNNTGEKLGKTGILVTCNLPVEEPGIVGTYCCVGYEICNNAIRTTGTELAGSPGIYIAHASRDGTVSTNTIEKPGGACVEAVGAHVNLAITDTKGKRAESATSGRGIYVKQEANKEERILKELFTEQGETAPSEAGIEGLSICGSRLRNIALQCILVEGTSALHLKGDSFTDNMTHKLKEESESVKNEVASISLKYVDGFTGGSSSTHDGHMGVEIESCKRWSWAGGSHTGAGHSGVWFNKCEVFAISGVTSTENGNGIYDNEANSEYGMIFGNQAVKNSLFNVHKASLSTVVWFNNNANDLFAFYGGSTKAKKALKGSWSKNAAGKSLAELLSEMGLLTNESTE